MKIRNFKSIIIIVVYILVNGAVITLSLTKKAQDDGLAPKPGSLAPEFTEIENLDYFHLKDGIPQMSLAATKMKSQGEELAEFEEPKGVYNYQQKKQTLRYRAREATYKKAKQILTLTREVKVTSDEAEYYADKVKYYMDKDLILGNGNVKFIGDDLKTHDQLTVESDSMRAKPQEQFSYFKGLVHGSLKRKKRYEGMLIFSSSELQMEGQKSLAHLEGNVNMKRDAYLITGGKADIFLENFNKSLKYFVMNDDVKVTETVKTPTGVTQRKTFSERLEGFGREQKMILSGAPRVEMGADVIKGYRITIRENVDLIEVDDAMSDMQMKQKKN